MSERDVKMTFSQRRRVLVHIDEYFDGVDWLGKVRNAPAAPYCCAKLLSIFYNVKEVMQMTNKASGSSKLKERCATIASLTPDDVNCVAGGYNSLDFEWWIRGVPADIFRFTNNQPVTPQVAVDQNLGFGG